jgi:hypothetical protein
VDLESKIASNALAVVGRLNSSPASRQLWLACMTMRNNWPSRGSQQLDSSKIAQTR